MNQLWQQEAREQVGPRFAEVLIEVRDSQRDMLERMVNLEIEMADMKREYKRIMTGFPADDVDGHRRYHQAVIEWRELRNKLVRQALEKALGAGFLAGAGWLLMAFWQSFKLTVTK